MDFIIKVIIKFILLSFNYFSLFLFVTLDTVILLLEGCIYILYLILFGLFFQIIYHFKLDVISNYDIYYFSSYYDTPLFYTKQKC